MPLIKQDKTSIKYILIIAIVALIIAESVGAYTKIQRAVSDMFQSQSAAEIMFSNEKSYINFNCNYSDVKILCDDIEAMVGTKPTIHSSTGEYCAYVKLSKEKEFRGEYYGDYWCIDSSLTSIGIKYIDPGNSGYCTGTTFRCPENDGVPSANLKAFLARENTARKIGQILPTFLLGVGLISGCAILFWNYLRRRKGKKSSLLLRGIGISLIVLSILWLLIFLLPSAR